MERRTESLAEERRRLFGRDGHFRICSHQAKQAKMPPKRTCIITAEQRARYNSTKRENRAAKQAAEEALQQAAQEKEKQRLEKDAARKREDRAKKKLAKKMQPNNNKEPRLPVESPQRPHRAIPRDPPTPEQMSAWTASLEREHNLAMKTETNRASTLQNRLSAEAQFRAATGYVVCELSLVC